MTAQTVRACGRVNRPTATSGRDAIGAWSSLPLGAAWARWPSGSSKPVRSCNPRLGRFDSGAAPSSQNRLTAGGFSTAWPPRCSSRVVPQQPARTRWRSWCALAHNWRTTWSPEHLGSQISSPEGCRANPARNPWVLRSCRSTRRSSALDVSGSSVISPLPVRTAVLISEWSHCAARTSRPRGIRAAPPHSPRSSRVGVRRTGRRPRRARRENTTRTPRRNVARDRRDTRHQHPS